MSDRLLAPAGYKSGDVPEGISWERKAYIVLPAQMSPSQHETREAIESALSEHGINAAVFRLRQVKGMSGHAFNLVNRDDLAELYKSIHRARVTVFALGGAKILLDISELPSNAGCVSLEDFIRYKCCYYIVTRAVEAKPLTNAAMAWMDEIHCEVPRDPRCLPKTIFKPRVVCDLETSDGRGEFIAGHKLTKHSTTMVDALQREWERGPAHSRDLLQVAGRTLPVGFHWDVQSKRETIIVTGWERWRLPGNSYVNVHPDAYVRGGNATKTHPLDQDKPAKTPRSIRRKRGR